MDITAITTEPRGVLELRHAIYTRPLVTREDLARLIQLGREAGEVICDEFTALLTEGKTDLLTDQVEPRKYVQQADADWLISQLQHDAGLAGRAEHENVARRRPLRGFYSAQPGRVCRNEDRVGNSGKGPRGRRRPRGA